MDLGPGEGRRAEGKIMESLEQTFYEGCDGLTEEEYWMLVESELEDKFAELQED